MVSVSCPRWVQRRMLRNLCATATNRLDPVRARKALAILAAIDRQANPPERQMQEKPVTFERPVEAVETAPEVVQRVVLRSRRLVEGLFRRFAAVAAGLRSAVQKSAHWIEQRRDRRPQTPREIREALQS